ncbi:MAG: polynucleotide adenylyltransferase PcnB [Sutterellaceae bacterium]|nr:polynucleotide adenylyltransferase PcnB [Sutterellaceae bacterium]
MFDYVKKVITNFIGRRNTEINREPRVIKASEHGINPKRVSFAARKTCENLQARGYKAYVVGGAVRDLLLGVTPKDFDVATDATPEQVKRCQRRAYIIGKRFRLVHVVFGEEKIECSTFRALDAAGQRKDASGRVISDNVFGEMWEDAARRDFTINALYYDPSTGDIFDYHGGYEDIRRKRLDMIGDPEERYREDPVRMMRAVRIASKLGFKIDSATERAIPKMAKNLENVPAARLFDETMKLFTSGHAEECLIKLRQEGLHRTLLPMLDVILKEKEGEEFLMLALRRTDERIASGKKISPAFLFATLLWPQVLKRWEAYQTRPKMIRSKALYAAADDVIATQCAKLAIQNRFVADMKLIWMLQLRFERRTGKNPYTLVEHVKYRAGYDFMLLRSLLGQVPAEDVRWWETFAEADEQTRQAMIAEQEKKARKTGDKARAGNRARRQEESFEVETVERLTEEQKPARQREAERRQKRRENRKNKNNLPAERKELLPAVSDKKEYLPSRFEDKSEAEANVPAEEKLVQVETVKPVESTKRRRKAKPTAAPEPVAPTPVVEEVLVQIETDPIYKENVQAEKTQPAESVKPAKALRTKKAKVAEEAAPEQSSAAEELPAPVASAEKVATKKRTRKARVKTEEATASVEVVVETPSEAAVVETAPVTENQPKKRSTRKVKTESVAESAPAANVVAVAETAPAPAPESETETKPAAKRKRRTAKAKVEDRTEVTQPSEEKPAEAKPRRTRKTTKTEDQTADKTPEVPKKRRTRTVKKTEGEPTTEEVVSPTSRRKPAVKRSALTHTAPKNDE